MFGWLPTDPEAQGYLLILAGTVLILLGALALAGRSAGRARRARRRANQLLDQLLAANGLIADLRKAVNITDRLLADLRRRYGADVNEHFDRTYPRWTLPGPPADDTVVMSAIDQTVVLTVVPAQTLVMTAIGAPLDTANVL